MDRERELYEAAYKKQARYAKKVVLAIFLTIGIIFTVVGALLLILDVRDEDNFAVGTVFLPLGIFWTAFGVVYFFAVPEKYDYEKFKRRIEKYGYRNYYEMSAVLEMLTQKNAELEARVKELEEKTGKPQ